MSILTSYYEWMVSFLGPRPGSRVWDAGAGIGIASRLLERRSEYVLATDIGADNIRSLERAFRSFPKIDVRECDLMMARAEDLPSGIDTIVHLDVLEHLTDDARALKLFHDRLIAGGRLLVKVPAHPCLFCEIDRASSHVRRYTKRGLKAKIERAGFQVSRISYVNMLGAMVYFAKGRILRHRKEFANTVSPVSFAIMNKLIPAYRRLEMLLPPIFGLSLVAVAVKDGR